MRLMRGISVGRGGAFMASLVFFALFYGNNAPKGMKTEARRDSLSQWKLHE